MTLNPGTHLGPYEIVAPLGVGGMGEVYRARDTRLGRNVALKVLPADLAHDAARRARFEQEARLLAALNHPNILGIFDIGDSYVVMELVDGSTLRGAQLPLRKVLDIGAQIAEGLAAAHGAGITHRDLKPDNVMVTKGGRVKILDFGLAKLRGPQGGEESRTAVSDPGAVMGTVGYMSPEQVRAQAVDGRSDIFSLGVLLHELIRGERPFQGDSAAEVMAAVAKTDAPPLSEGTPSGVVRVIDGCLAKQPEERWQSARDLARQLRWLADGGTSTSIQKPLPRRRNYWPWSITAAVTLLLMGLVFIHFRQTPPEAPPMEFIVNPPDKATSLENPTISPDGLTLAFTATVDGKEQLWIRPLDSLAARPLAGTEDAHFPFWSPDNRFLGFFAQGKLKKVEKSGGAAQTLCDATDGGRGGTWSRSGLIVFNGSIRGPLSKVPESGGTPTAVTALGDGALAHRWPQFLPDGQHFLYLTWKDSDRDQSSSVFAARLDGPAQSSQHQHLVRAGVMPFYADGLLLFLREDATLVAQSFDIGKGILSGEAVPLGANIARRSGLRGRAEYSASSNGVLAYVSGSRSQSRLEWRDRAGQLLSALGEPGHWRDVALSHDGRLVAASRDDTQSNSDLWLHDVSRNTSTRFTSDPGFDGWPVWSPDSTQVLFTSFRGAGGLYKKDASSATEEKLLLKATPGDLFYTWSFDGRHLLYSVVGQKGNPDLWVLSVDGESQPVPFLATDFEELTGQFSPDGRWVAYQSNESGRQEIYVRGFPQTTGELLVSVAGGAQPRWRRDGREIYYVAPDNKLMAVEVKPSSATLGVGSPKELFTVKLPGSFGYDYDVTADGKRFLVNSVIEGAVPPITVVLNWPRKLKKP